MPLTEAFTSGKRERHVILVKIFAILLERKNLSERIQVAIVDTTGEKWAEDTVALIQEE